MSNQELVTLTIDGKEVSVPKGTNLIEAALSVGIDIPYYCYHPHLSIAGNCRMCQVQVGGSPKLAIGCNTGAAAGMVVNTHHTSQAVADAQRATLEFLLINHPLDCTVCDQAGHCKLQDYYYEYNRTASRFIEEKVHKVKAEELGPEVMYDGERCIMCTRCVRFCDEVTGTSELAVFNRGDKSVIGIQPGTELANPLSGTVVDLCPVGALTHSRWRFNTRIWYTSQQETICTGCSTGCNAKVAIRDDQVVTVKARLNAQVNQEWMCDEGRYGFHRFQPATRITEPLLRVAPKPDEPGALEEVAWRDALAKAAQLKNPAAEDKRAVFLSPALTLEEVWTALRFADKVMGLQATSASVAMQLVRRSLTDAEKVLVSPDYAPNAAAMRLFGVAQENDWREALEKRYLALLERVRSGQVSQVLLVGDGAIRDADVDEALVQALLGCDVSVATSPRGLLTGEVGEQEVPLGAHQLCSVLFPSRTVNEKTGVMVNRDGRLQRLLAVLSPPFGSHADWTILCRIAAAAGAPIVPETLVEDRALFREMVKQNPGMKGVTLVRIGTQGVALNELSEISPSSTASSAGVQEARV